MTIIYNTEYISGYIQQNYNIAVPPKSCACAGGRGSHSYRFSECIREVKLNKSFQLYNYTIILIEKSNSNLQLSTFV